ncbi:Rid family detoxifying hydrolase [Candidatus Saccharibacteria bacterium]|nr:Rid family detoxifying hydrolase [Candidatus Saccharibacteria bacterium]
MSKKQHLTNDAPSAPHILSQAIESNGFVFVSGQIHNKPDGTLVEGSVKDKLDQIMLNTKNVLVAAGSSLDSVVKVVIYVTDMSQMSELNEVYPSYFSEPYPVREAVCVKELPLSATIEISVIATKE